MRELTHIDYNNYPWYHNWHCSGVLLVAYLGRRNWLITVLLKFFVVVSPVFMFSHINYSSLMYAVSSFFRINIRYEFPRVLGVMSVCLSMRCSTAQRNGLILIIFQPNIENVCLVLFSNAKFGGTYLRQELRFSQNRLRRINQLWKCYKRYNFQKFILTILFKIWILNDGKNELGKWYVSWF